MAISQKQVENGVEVVRLDDASHLPDELRDRLDFKKI